MTPEEIPQELIDHLDMRAGIRHSRTGSVLTTLAELLTLYDQLRAQEPLGKRFPAGQSPEPTPLARTINLPAGKSHPLT